MMAGLVAVGVLADATGDVWLFATGRGAVDREERVEGFLESGVASERGYVVARASSTRWAR